MFKLVKISADLAKFMKVHEATRPDIQRAM